MKDKTRPVWLPPVTRSDVPSTVHHWLDGLPPPEKVRWLRSCDVANKNLLCLTVKPTERKA